jgi:uncharacterized membrane protein YfcA
MPDALTLLEAAMILAAGFAAGAINAAVGSGSLITFPTLLALGYPAVVANVTNTLGLVPGSVAGAWGYRRELRGTWDVARPLVAASATGALLGAVLLIAFPDAFGSVVPFLVGGAVVLVLVQPWISASARRHVRHSVEEYPRSAPRPTGSVVGPLLLLGVLLSGVYGGYFGAAQGVLLIGILGLGLQVSLQQVNAVKNVLAGTANLVSGIVYAIFADVAWDAAGLVAVGAIAGGLLGAGLARRLPATALRAVVVVVGIVALVMVLVS